MVRLHPIAERTLVVIFLLALSLPLVVVAPEGTQGQHPVRFVVETTDGAARETVDSNFFGPM